MNATDTTQPDAAILEAFEKVRAQRAYAYTFDNVPDVDEATEQAIAAADVEMLANEDIVHGSIPSTVAGVIARLKLAIPAIDQDRWIDKTLMQHGLLALHARRTDLTSDVQQITIAAANLLRIDWQDALSVYELSSANFNAILDAKALTEHEQMACRRAGEPSEFAETIAKKIEVLTDELMDQDCANVDRLIATPVPDWAAYRRKAEIAIKEAVADKAGPFLLRDANALLAAQEGEA